MPTELAPVTPSLMRWARESVGVSVEEAAARAGVVPSRIEMWENGEQEPTVAKARALAKLYQRPFSVLFLSDPPSRSFDTIRDFRRLPGIADHNWSRALHKVHKRAVEQQEAALEILADEGEAPVSGVPASSVSMDPERAGKIARDALGVSLGVQFAWSKPEASFAGWLEAVESLGILVMRTSEVPSKEMRGFSITGALPVIVVNALDWPRGQVYTLMHEFAHLMLREGGLCDLLEPSGKASRDVEKWCNAVAASVLMPAEDFLDNEVLGESGIFDWEDEVLAQLSSRWGVSQEAVVRRLVTLGRATEQYYSEKRRQYQDIYEEKREEERRRRRSSQRSGGPPPYRMALRDRGRPFVRIVLDAYHRDVLSPSSASSLLSLKVKHFENLEREVGV